MKDPSGLTIEGLQEFYDEACLAVLNNKYQDGIQWHDVPCYFRWVLCHRRAVNEPSRSFTVPVAPTGATSALTIKNFWK